MAGEKGALLKSLGAIKETPNIKDVPTTDQAHAQPGAKGKSKTISLPAQAYEDLEVICGIKLWTKATAAKQAFALLRQKIEDGEI